MPAPSRFTEAELDELESAIAAHELWQERVAWLKRHPEPRYSVAELDRAAADWQLLERWDEHGRVTERLRHLESCGVLGCPSCHHTWPVYRDMGLRDLLQVVRDVLPMVANLSFIVASGLLFAWMLVIEQVPATVVDLIAGSTQDKWLLLTIVVVAFLVIGCFVEASIVFIVVAPMILPALVAVGIDEVHFGIVTVIAMGIGMFTPPVGIGLYMMRDLCEMRLEEVMKAMLPFLAALLLCLALIIYVPTITTFLPRYLGLMPG